MVSRLGNRALRVGVFALVESMLYTSTTHAIQKLCAVAHFSC